MSVYYTPCAISKSEGLACSLHVLIPVKSGSLHLVISNKRQKEEEEGFWLMRPGKHGN